MNAVLQALTSWERTYTRTLSTPVVIPTPDSRMPCEGREYEADELAREEHVSPGCMWCTKWRLCSELGHVPQPDDD